jgi:hypothetical protein
MGDREGQPRAEKSAATAAIAELAARLPMQEVLILRAFSIVARRLLTFCG